MATMGSQYIARRYQQEAMGARKDVAAARMLKRRRDMDTALAMRANREGDRRVQAANVANRMRDIEMEQANRLYREITQLAMELRYKSRQLMLKRRAFAMQLRKLRALGLRERRLMADARRLEQLEQRAALRGSLAGTIMENKVTNVGNSMRQLPRRFR